jgi:hypothetical protein
VGELNIDDGAMLKIRWKIFKRSINDGKILENDENGKEILGRSITDNKKIKRKSQSVAPSMLEN